MNRIAFPVWLLIGSLLLALTACIVDDTGPIRSGFAVTTPYDLDIPSNLPPMPVPADNPTTVQGVELGRRLFYDPILSVDSTISCGSCHLQEYAFSDGGKRFSEGVNGLLGDMNSMAIINVGWAPEHFWDGREPGLEAQAVQPVQNPVEMAADWNDILIRLNQHPDYLTRFESVFGKGEITLDKTVKAIAQFERTLISANSPYDKFQRGEDVSASEFGQAEFNGQQLFFTETGDCFHCHNVDLLTNNDYHNNGIDSVFGGGNEGRFKVTGNPADLGKFKAPTLRNVALTAPYMHDGRFATLEEVIDHYDANIRDSDYLDPLLEKQRGNCPDPLLLCLTDQQKSDLIAFLHALTDTSFIHNPAFSNPFE